MPAETHSHREADVETVRSIVVEHAGDLLGVDQADLDDTTPIDPVVLVALVDRCREELAERTVGLRDDDLAEAETLGDLFDLVAPDAGDRIGGDTGASRAGTTGDDPSTTHTRALGAAVGYRFRDPGLLRQALAHRSYVAEHDGAGSNERLEFLGDAVLSLVVAEALYRRYSDEAEGTLAKARAAVVSACSFLSAAAQRYRLGDAVLLGHGEEVSGGREKPSILADALEAVIGAVYLDGGIEAAERFVLDIVADSLEDAVSGEGRSDFKTRLQEAAAQRWARLPEYTVSAHGPDHAKRFEAEVRLNGWLAGSGRGRSKKQAEQAAARAALDTLATDSASRRAERDTSNTRFPRSEEEPHA